MEVTWDMSAENIWRAIFGGGVGGQVSWRAISSEVPLPPLAFCRTGGKGQGVSRPAAGDSVGVTVRAEMSHSALRLAARPSHLLLARVLPGRGGPSLRAQGPRMSPLKLETKVTHSVADSSTH